ncbi:uncharacterized protein LOC144589480 [Pogona vitticeps]
MASPSPFKRCTTCANKIAFSDDHSQCLFCLGEEHPTHSCPACKNLTKPALKQRLQRLWSYLWKTAMNPPRTSSEAARSPALSADRLPAGQSTSDSTSMLPAKDTIEKAKSSGKHKLPSSQRSRAHDPGPKKKPKPAPKKLRKNRLPRVEPPQPSLPSPILEESCTEAPDLALDGEDAHDVAPPPRCHFKLQALASLGLRHSPAQPQPIPTLTQGRQLKARHLIRRFPLLLHGRERKNESTSFHRGLWHRKVTSAPSPWYRISVLTPTSGKPCMKGTSLNRLNGFERCQNFPRPPLLWTQITSARPLLPRQSRLHLHTFLPHLSRPHYLRSETKLANLYFHVPHLRCRTRCHLKTLSRSCRLNDTKPP